MNHAQKNKNISKYNTFEVFEDIYEGNADTSYDELDIPVHHDTRNFSILKTLLSFIIILLVGFSIHPVLSYTLKTPYPLVVITENSMSPAFAKDDIIVVKGIISKNDIIVGDIVVFNPESSLRAGDINNLLVRKVISIEDNAIVVSDYLGMQGEVGIYPEQIIGRVAGEEQNLHFPFLGKISNLFKS